MERPGSSLVVAIALHAAVVGAFLLAGLLGWGAREVKPMVNSVPVSIVSETVIQAAAADNPSEELVTDDAATAPVAPPLPEPTPAPPEPTPPPPVRPTPPKKTAPTPTPPRPTPPPRAQPPARPQPPRPAPPRREETLDLDALAGPARPAPNRQGTRPPTGQQGAGSASRATGPQVAAIFNQVYPNWILPCDIPGARDLRIQMDVTVSADGRITSGPTLIGPRSDPVWRAAADGAVRAIRQTAPFDVPQGFEGGTFRPTFVTERACANR